MSLSIGIVGLPNVGKSTLFTALTKKTGLAANYPFATIDLTWVSSMCPIAACKSSPTSSTPAALCRRRSSLSTSQVW